MNTEFNKNLFLSLLDTVQRDGMDKLKRFLVKSDFFTAPSSTKYHLSCEGGLCQHSLNVYNALLSMAEPTVDWSERSSDVNSTTRSACPNGNFRFHVYGQPIAECKLDTLTVAALLHDVCKVNFYRVAYKNQKVYSEGGSKQDAGGNYDWQSVPYYTVNDTIPYGHGEKSVMMLTEYIRLTAEEKYAIRWHMGFSGESAMNTQSLNAAIGKYPLIWFLHSADMLASRFIEAENGNNAAWETTGEGEIADNADLGEWQEV